MNANVTREVLILAGGLGTRLRPVVSDRPKPVAEVAGRPFLEHLLDQVLRYEYGRAILCVGYRAHDVRSRLGDRFGALELAYSEEESPLGTGGALGRAADLARSPDVLVMNGDSFCAVDLAGFEAAHRRFGGDATMAVLHREDRSGVGAVRMDGTNRILAFASRADSVGAGLINAGVYMFRTDVLCAFPKRKVSLEEEIFPALAERERLYGWPVDGRFIDIGTADSYRAAQDFFRESRGR